MPVTPLPRSALGAPLPALHEGLKGVVLPTDFSPQAEGVLPVALAIAERTGADVYLVHVMDPVAVSVAPWREQQAQARLAATRLHYRHGLLGRARVHTAVLPSGDAGAAVGAYARQEGAGLIVVPVQHAARYTAHAACPVLVVPPGNPGLLRRLVWAGASGTLADILGRALAVPVENASGDGALPLLGTTPEAVLMAVA